MYLTRLPVFLVSVFLALQPGMEGEAFFSKDGKTVTIGLCNVRTGLVQVDLATGKITKAPLPKELEGECIESVAQGADGEALFLAKDAVWVWTAKGVKRIYSTAPVVGAADLFVATLPGTPLTDCLFVSGNETADATSRGSFYGRKSGGKSKAFVSVFCRRVSNATSGVFSADGRLFFINDGDVWEGGIQMDDDDAGMERLGGARWRTHRTLGHFKHGHSQRRRYVGQACGSRWELALRPPSRPAHGHDRAHTDAC